MARVDVITFTRNAKGIVDYAVDMGGEVPKAVILLTNYHDPANGTAGTAYASQRGPDVSIGFAVQTDDSNSGYGTHAEHKMIQQDGNSVQSSNTRYSNALLLTGTTFSQDWEVYLESVAPDQVSLNFVNAPISLGNSRQFTLIVFGGDDCLAHHELINLGTGTSAIDITAPGFEPDIVFAAHCARSATGLSSSGAAFGLFTMGVGINDGADTQRCIGRRDGSGTLTVNRQNFCVLDNRIAVFLNGGTSPSLGAQVTIGDYDASGFSVTPSASHSSIIMSALAIQAPGIDFNLDDYLTPTSNGTQTVTGLAFQPDILFVIGGGSTTINTPSGPNAANATSYMSVTKDGGDSGMYLMTSQFNVDPSNSINYSNDDGSLISLGDPTVDGIIAGEFAAFTADGFEIEHTTTNGTAYLFLGLAMTSGGGPPPESSNSLDSNSGSNDTSNSLDSNSASNGIEAEGTQSGLIFVVM